MCIRDRYNTEQVKTSILVNCTFATDAICVSPVPERRRIGKTREYTLHQLHYYTLTIRRTSFNYNIYTVMAVTKLTKLEPTSPPTVKHISFCWITLRT